MLSIPQNRAVILLFPSRVAPSQYLRRKSTLRANPKLSLIICWRSSSRTLAVSTTLSHVESETPKSPSDLCGLCGSAVQSQGADLCAQRRAHRVGCAELLVDALRREQCVVARCVAGS